MEVIDPKYRKKVYGALKGELGDKFGKTEEEFNTALDQDDTYAKKVYGALKGELGDKFNKTEDEFYGLVLNYTGEEKKSAPSFDLSASQQSNGGFEINQEIKQKLTGESSPEKEAEPMWAMQNPDLYNERQDIQKRLEERSAFATSDPELTEQLKDVDNRIAKAMGSTIPYRSAKNQLAEIAEKKQAIEANANKRSQSSGMSVDQILMTDGGYEQLREQEENIKSSIVLEQTMLDKIKEDTNSDTGTKAFFTAIGRPFGIQDESEETIELDAKVEDQIISNLSGNRRQKEKIAKGFASLPEKERMIKQAKVEVLTGEMAKIQKDADDLKKTTFLSPDEYNKKGKELIGRQNKLLGIAGYDKADEIVKNSFKKSDVSEEFNEAFSGDGFFASTGDALASFGEGLAQTAYKGTLGFASEVISGIGDMATDDKKYSLFDAFNDSVQQLGNFNFAPSSEAESTRLVDKDGDYNIGYKTVTKSLAQTLPFTLMLVNDVKKGKISNIEATMGKMLNPTKSKGVRENLSMVDSAFRYTFSDNVQAGRDLGLDDNKSRTYGFVLSSAEGMAQLIMPDVKFFEGTVGKTLLNNFKGNLQKATSKKAMSQAAKTFMKDMALEIGEEEVVLATEDLTKYAMVVGHENSEFWDIKNQKELVAATVAMSGTLGARKAVGDVKLNTIENYKKISENIGEVTDFLNDEYNNPRSTEENKAEIKKALDFAQNLNIAVDHAPENVTSEQIDLLMKKQDLIKKMEKLDPAFHPKVKEQVEAVEEQIRTSPKPKADAKQKIKTDTDTEKSKVDPVRNTERATRPVAEKSANTPTPVKGKTVKPVKSVKGATYNVEYNEDNSVSKIYSPKSGREIPKFIERTVKKTKKNPTGKKLVRNGNYFKIEADALGKKSAFQIEQEAKAKMDETIGNFEPTDSYSYALKALASGSKVNSKSARNETGLSAKEVKWASGMTKDADLKSVEGLAEQIVQDAPIDLDVQDVRNELIDLIRSNTSQSELQEQVAEQYGQDVERMQDQEMDAFKNTLSSKELPIFEASLAEEEYLKDLSYDEKIQYYEEQFESKTPAQTVGEREGGTPSVQEREGEKGSGKSEKINQGDIDQELSKNDPIDSFIQKLDNLDDQLKDFGDETLGMALPIVVARGGIKAMKAAVKAGKTTAQAIQAGLDYVKGTDWYKNLSKADKTDIDNNFIERLQETPKKSTKQKLSGIKKDLAPKEVQENTPTERQSFKDMLDDGMDMVENTDFDPEETVRELIDKPRALQAHETAALIYYKRKLDNDALAIAERLNTAYDKGNQEKINELEAKMRTNNLRLDNYHVMQIKSGTEAGRALASRKMMLNSEYELARQIVKLRAVNKGMLPNTVRIKFEQYDKEMKALNKKIEQLEKEKKEAIEQIEPFRKSTGTRKSWVKKPTAKELERKKELRKELLGGKLFDITSMAALAVNPKMYEYARIVFKEAGGDFEQFSRKLLSDIGEKFKQYLPELYEKTLESVRQEELPDVRVSDDGMLSIPNKLIRALVEQGYDTIDKLTDEVYSIINDGYPEISKRQVRDLITDYGKTVNLDKSELSTKVRELMRTGRLVSALEDVQNGKPPKRSGLQREKPTDAQRRLMREIKEGMKDIPQSEMELKQEWATALEATKNRYRNVISDLEEQLKTGKKPNKKGKPVELDAEAELLKQTVGDLREEVEKVFGRSGMSDEQRIKAATAQVEKMIEIYEGKINRKDFAPLNSNPVPKTKKLTELREQLKKVREEYNELREEATPLEKKQEKANEKRLKQLTARERKLKERIDNNEAEYKRKGLKAEETPQIKAAEQRIDALNEILQTMREEQGIVERKRVERYKKNLERSIDNYNERIKQKDYAPRKTASKPDKVSEEIRQLEIEKMRTKQKFDVEQVKYRLKNRNKREKFWDTTMEILNIPRSLMATADFSAPLRQGIVLSVANPKAAYRATKMMFRHWASQKKNDDWLFALQGSEIYPQMKDAGLYLSEPSAELSAREEQFISRYFQMIPVLGSVTRASERAYSTYLNAIRVDVYTRMSDQLEKRESYRDNPKPFKEIAKFINAATGRGSLPGQYDQSVAALNLLMFSPRYVLSRVNLVTSGAYISSSPEVRREAWRTIVSYMGFGTTILMLAAAAGADVEEDPRSSDFAKIKVGNIRYDIWAGLQQWIRMIRQVQSGQRKNSRTGEISELDGFGKSVFDPMLSFGRSKLSPALSYAVNAKAGKDMVGNEFDWFDDGWKLFVPLWAPDIYEVSKAEGMSTAIFGVFLPNNFGIGVQYYQTDTVKKAKKEMEGDPEFETIY